MSHSLQLFVFPLNKIKLFLISDKISSILNQVRTGLSTFFRSTHKKHTQDAAQRSLPFIKLFFESSLPLSSLLHQRLLVGPSYCKCGYRFVPLVCSLCSAIETAHIIFTRITTHAHPSAEDQIVPKFFWWNWNHAHTQTSILSQRQKERTQVIERPGSSWPILKIVRQTRFDFGIRGHGEHCYDLANRVLLLYWFIY